MGHLNVKSKDGKLGGGTAYNSTAEFKQEG